MNRFIRSLIIVGILVCNIGCDQISKHVVRRSIQSSEEISVIPKIVMLTRVENKGAFLSLGSELPPQVRFVLLSVLPVIVLTLALLFLFTQKSLSGWSMVAICFVVGGGIGNIYDRIVHGSVTDFLHINFGIFQTGIFNMADVSVMAGVFLALAESYHKRRRANVSETAE